MSKWRDEVEAAVYRLLVADHDEDVGEFTKSHAALLDLVTKGRCPECGHYTRKSYLRYKTTNLLAHCDACGWTDEGDE